MRRIISILFLSLMLLQAIPVLHFFSSHKAVFYAYIDEEKPGDKKEVKESIEYVCITNSLTSFSEEEKTYPPFFLNDHSSPLLEQTTPPPDAC